MAAWNTAKPQIQWLRNSFTLHPIMWSRPLDPHITRLNHNSLSCDQGEVISTLASFPQECCSSHPSNPAPCQCLRITSPQSTFLFKLLNWNINNGISLIKNPVPTWLFIVLRAYALNNMPILMVSGYYVTVCIYSSPYHSSLTWVHFCRQINGANASHCFCSLQMDLTSQYSMLYPLTGLLTHITSR